MDDKERIEYIIRDKGLSNVEFAAITGIAPATISHIASGRSKPTLPILKGVLAGFPDLNPEWVFLGVGPMYKTNLPDMTSGDNAASASQSANGLDLFSSFANDDNEQGTADTRRSSHQSSSSNAKLSEVGEIKDVIRESFEAVMGKRRRQIVEVRIFFDDGTYEAFSTPKTK